VISPPPHHFPWHSPDATLVGTIYLPIVPSRGFPMPSNILVLSASVGAGHMRAAQAVELALRQLAPDANVQNIDLLTLTNPAFRRVYGKAYLDLVNLAPHVLGYVYDLLDKPREPDSTRDRLRLAVEKINLTKFTDLLAEGRWNIVIN